LTTQRCQSPVGGPISVPQQVTKQFFGFCRKSNRVPTITMCFGSAKESYLQNTHDATCVLGRFVLLQLDAFGQPRLAGSESVGIHENR
jgi:hypothetical protein